MKTNKWEVIFLTLAKHIANWSYDPVVKVGAVLVNSSDKREYYTGYNGFPRGIKDNLYRYDDKKTKHNLIIHAELNAIFNAQRSLKGFTMYSSRFPCLRCTLAILQSGITDIVTVMPSDLDIEKHRDSYQQVLSVANEAQVTIKLLSKSDKHVLIGDFVIKLLNEQSKEPK